MAEVKKTKVIVAMSGGVDSSVAAALLKRAGFDVIGVHMKFWVEGKKSRNRCCTPESEKKARMVAKSLGISFYVFNFEKEFKKRVVDYFLKEEKAGRTPNPCVVCNKEIKFGLLLEKALKLGAEYVATGHYSRIQPGLRLLKAKDRNKDQSYFLWQLNQRQLKHILFPVGNYTKPEVRILAKKFKLPVAKIKESQEVCFVNTEVSDFLKRHLKTKPGSIIDLKGNILGEHKGLWFYTIGQRKGIGIAARNPYYVLRKDAKRNELVVTQDNKDLLQKELTARSINWVSGVEPRLPLKANIKIRYRSPSVSAVIKKDKNGIKTVFAKPQRAVTPGQSVVFYSPSKILRGKTSEGKGEELLGGGIIQ